MHHDADLAADAIRGGASGLLLKESAGDELLTAVRHAPDGRVYITPTVTQEIVERMAGSAEAKAPQVTPRQRDILRLIVKGQRMKEIAATLGLSTRTVEGHKYQMMEALGSRLRPNSSGMPWNVGCKSPRTFSGPLLA
jgi:two-component system response regulator NreC